MSRLSDLAADLAAGDLTEDDYLTPQRNWLAIQVLAAADAIVGDLAVMDRGTAIELTNWPAAQRLAALAGRTTLIVRPAGGAL